VSVSRVAKRLNVSRPTSFEEYRAHGEYAAIESRAFWKYVLAPPIVGSEGAT
jgi:hypothetical protein